MFSKKQIWLITQTVTVIFAIMLWGLKLKPGELLEFSAYFAVCAFAITLLIGPAHVLLPNQSLVKNLFRNRRSIGIAAFTYAFMHFCCFIMKLNGFDNFLNITLKPALWPVFWIGLPILAILAITSNNWSVKKLSFFGWKKVHRLVYVAQIAITWHVWLMGQKQIVMYLLVPVVIVQLLAFYKRKI